MKRLPVLPEIRLLIKPSFLVILAILLCFNLLAAGEVWLNPHGGLSLPNLKGGTNELSQGYTSRKAPFFGLGLEFRLSPSAFLKTGLSYSSQGGQRNGLQPLAPDQISGLPVPPGVTLYADFQNETILDYLEVPVMIELVTGQSTQFFVEAGLYAGYRVRAKTVTEGTSLIYLDPDGSIPIDSNLQVPFDAETDVSQEINRWNYGLCGGLGVKVPLGSGQVLLGGRFNYGLANIQSHPEITGKNRSGGLIITLGYLFRL
ncbi:MAG: porin family protein [Candidatus Saccharicenans sp.]|uniref:porin family protein n=1 Tax=Candidatus Saccharicenans sp. TaxID=2819258 RepID=UPI004049046E